MQLTNNDQICKFNINKEEYLVVDGMPTKTMIRMIKLYTKRISCLSSNKKEKKDDQIKI